LCVEWLMPVQSGETTNILLLLQGQHQCVLVALAKTVSQFTHNCTHIHTAPAHRVSYLHSLVLPCEAGTNFTYNYHAGMYRVPYCYVAVNCDKERLGYLRNIGSLEI